MQQLIHFLLVPDGSAARRLRRTIAAQSPCMGLIVGTWPELIEQAKSAYVIANPASDWKARFHGALESIPDAFWFNSFEVAPEETATEVESALSLLVSATEPGVDIDLTNADQLPVRPHKHVHDIAKLLRELEGLLPDELLAIQQLISEDPSTAIRQIAVYHTEGSPSLTRWQAALISKLNSDAGIERDAELVRFLESLLLDQGAVPPQTSLQVLQQQLFASPDEKPSLDATVQWLGVRDFLQEAEVAAGMVQTMLAENQDVTPSDIGLLVPDTFEYSLAVNDAFTAAGVPLSGLPVDHWQRDLGREALFHFLYCRQKPSPAMALAVCLSSPLMPWSKEQGAELAQTVMDGDYRLRAFASAIQTDRQMLDLLRQGDERPETLIAAVQAFVNLLDGGELFESHVFRAKATAEEVCEMLARSADIDWISLRRLSSPKNISTGETPNFNLEGVTVWRETQETWHPVRFLIVLGFASGHYPGTAGDSAVFVSDDLQALRDKLGLPVATPADQMRERRARFKRQIAAVTDFVCFMVPHRDASGASQSPSESLVFMSQLYGGIDDAESLILEMDVAVDRDRIRFLAQAESEPPHSPRTILAEDIQFGFDLLTLRADAEGNIRPESPSSLETLMVSRLAWLLRRIDAEPLGWEPERPNVMLLGTLTHQVLEELFQASRPIPDRQMIGSQVEPLLDSAIRTHAPFLRAAQWQVERKHLAASIHKAALAWREVLVTLNAEILGTEEWLEGNLEGLPIHGQADILLGLPDGRLLVVDYKRSSASSRRPRMQKGYDSQANLYRTMLQTGGPKSEDNAALLERLRAGDTTGIVYFMTNDQTSLSDALVVESGAIPGWEVLEGDVAEHAMALIRERLREVRAGELFLNREGDALFFDKQAGVKPYALDNSALIPLFTIPGEAREAE
ncbi:MAG: PD-(D/E)XK nuclease family protein [Candidatus Thiodiazotropha taylori]|nr:PD-(D/E)XK nuclease family protein [Candidatus Thiodiazotropha taylori]MCW4225433.1 PD-(D/E)XK nuclease family protein [Candidatus Thiodiazotropha endolucinida]MCG7887003.1 PD-(D/E)XK nuclease family protein [Candidatus Thiodiazotropha taylori]MCG7889304.1 PD-(D/E)XK nuclease family protein [Candidatus Thiodiazotropha taylori]MCG8033600.1 PD-(D/E)XK nuclease family protein [Candidatus Thiodiazotropha taylori]